jgi:hypothetical protein
VIAAVLDISAWTVSTHIRRIFGKLSVTSRAAMVARMAEIARRPDEILRGSLSRTLSAAQLREPVSPCLGLSRSERESDRLADGYRARRGSDGAVRTTRFGQMNYRAMVRAGREPISTPGMPDEDDAADGRNAQIAVRLGLCFLLRQHSAMRALSLAQPD